ncbi:MAG: hypothetical protein IJZ57_04485 [Clostridia bacterium]|nr:hypothetical protein [Clostridia bacterium]
MEAVFLKMLNMCITAGWIALAVIIIRFHLKKAPRVVSLFLWALVAVRLVFPFSIESFLSLIPNDETIPYDIMYAAHPNIQTGIPNLGAGLNSYMYFELAPNPTESVNPMQIIVFVASIIWLVGMGIMMLYALISYIKICQKVSGAVCLKGNIFYCDTIDTPFILGFFKPRIYLPSGISEQDAQYVINHEMSHIKRLDHIWKPLGFLLLAVYWYNPILWVAYILFCKDIELACDERVIREMGEKNKKPYSLALINCNASKRMVTVCPLAFGETGVKSRIKSVLNYKKPSFWVVMVCVVLCVALSVCFLTDPKQSLRAKNETVSYPHYISEHLSADYIIYEAGHYSSVFYKEDYLMPSFYVWWGDKVLHTTPHPEDFMNSDWYEIGELTEFELTKDNFDCLMTNEIWVEGFSAETLRMTCEQAYIATDGGGRIYYVLKQRNGETFIAQGYAYPERQEIRWVFKLKAQSSGKTP